MAKCKDCGITTGRGKRHKPDCPAKKTSTATTTATASSGIRIDGRTSIPNLLKWQAEIEEQLKGRKASDVKSVKKAMAEIAGLEEKLAEAKRLAGV